MTSRLPPEREGFPFPILPGISRELQGLHREGWAIEPMRLDLDEDALEVIARRAAAGEQNAGGRNAGV